MATKNILDNQGNIIGTLTLEDTTSEEQWHSQLKLYTEEVIYNTDNFKTSLLNYKNEILNTLDFSQLTELQRKVMLNLDLTEEEKQEIKDIYG